jgi:hypothetical protein
VRTRVDLSFCLPLVVTAFLLPGGIDAQTASGADHTVVIEIGSAGQWPLQGERPSYGGTLAAETTPIEHWLEVEAGATLLGMNHRREIAADFIVKKPFEISSTVELMAGVGPELSWTLTRGSPARSVATECALDLMIWPTKNVGWYLEPTYDLTSFRASGRSLALAAGLIVGLPWLR